MSCPWGAQPSDLEEKEGEREDTSIIQGKLVSSLLYHLDTHRSLGLNGICL